MVMPESMPEIATALALARGCLAEWLHSRRVTRVARLAFGPRGRPAAWALAAPTLRVLGGSLLAWGLATLCVLPPRAHSSEGGAAQRAEDPRHILLVLDVSPSMRLVDAGKDQKQSRMQRARDVMESFFDRVPFAQTRVSVVAVYSGAKPVVIDTSDFEVVRNILGDLPMHHAFKAGKTELFAGLEEAAKVAKDWNPGSTTLVVVSDGDTVPATGMPRMPVSIHSTIVVGVGDPQTGRFIDGRHSRQDVATLKQIAARLGGVFHNANETQLASAVIQESFAQDEDNPFERLTRREYALFAIGLGAALLALLPLALHLLGTGWKPGVPAARALEARRAGAEPPVGIA
jgi:Ca-activated chloride channel family protein